MSRLRRFCTLALIGMIVSGGVSADVFDVRGAGWWEDRLIERALRDLRASNDSAIVDANAVEDAVFFAMSSVAEKGFLEPSVTAIITPVEGEIWTHEFDLDFANLLPRPLAASQVRLELNRGLRFRFGDVVVTGTEPIISADDAADLIVPPSGLFPSAEAQAFTPDRLQSGLSRIELVLRDEGYAEAVALVREESRDSATGRVDVVVEVETGPRWWVRSVNIAGAPAESLDLPEIKTGREVPWNLTWAQDQAGLIRQVMYPAGFADVRVVVNREPESVMAGERPVEVTLTVAPGSVVEMGPVTFLGEGNLHPDTLKRRVQVRAGEVLNVLELEQTRRRLARLPALRRVALDYEPSTGDVRSPVFILERRLPWESHLLVGWGSYEKLRGGVEVRGNNLWHRSHEMRLEGMVSAKSLRGDLIYTVPEVFGETVDVSLRLFGLDRDEFSFNRREVGSTVALSRRDLPWVEADGAVSYTFENLASDENQLATRTSDRPETRSASVTFTLNRDRRDNPLSPSEGYRWFTQLEVADEALGGEVGYQRMELGVSWHRRVADTAGIHVGLSHGTVWTLGQPNDLDLPVNKRFFPGGEQSYRGVQNGEGIPVAPNGEFIGAKSFTLLNLEFEQALTTRFSAVVFSDVLSAAAELSDPFGDDVLVAAGVGIRYDTIIGPLRLEYAHNLNPRPVDPSGTLHFSIGFPF